MVSISGSMLSLHRGMCAREGAGVDSARRIHGSRVPGLFFCGDPNHEVRDKQQSRRRFVRQACCCLSWLPIRSSTLRGRCPSALANVVAYRQVTHPGWPSRLLDVVRSCFDWREPGIVAVGTFAGPATTAIASSAAASVASQSPGGVNTSILASVSAVFFWRNLGPGARQNCTARAEALAPIKMSFTPASASALRCPARYDTAFLPDALFLVHGPAA